MKVDVSFFDLARHDVKIIMLLHDLIHVELDPGDRVLNTLVAVSLIVNQHILPLLSIFYKVNF